MTTDLEAQNAGLVAAMRRLIALAGKFSTYDWLTEDEEMMVSEAGGLLSAVEDGSSPQIQPSPGQMAFAGHMAPWTKGTTP